MPFESKWLKILTTWQY